MKITSPEGNIKEIKIEDRDMPIEIILKELGIHPFEVIIIKNNKLVSKDETVTNDDKIGLFRLSGGG